MTAFLISEVAIIPFLGPGNQYPQQNHLFVKLTASFRGIPEEMAHQFIQQLATKDGRDDCAHQKTFIDENTDKYTSNARRSPSHIIKRSMRPNPTPHPCSAGIQNALRVTSARNQWAHPISQEKGIINVHQSSSIEAKDHAALNARPRQKRPLFRTICK